MKITSKIDAATSFHPSYPWLGVSENSLVVLFTSNSTGVCLRGVCLRQGYTSFSIGHYSTQWNELNFKPVRSVTLHQEL